MLTTSSSSAYGEFECTHDCTDITSASFLSKVGKKSDVLLRISTVGPERGSADTARDVHGWGMKIYTDEGNQDFVCNNIVRRWNSIGAKISKLANEVRPACLLRPGSDQVSLRESLS